MDRRKFIGAAALLGANAALARPCPPIPGLASDYCPADFLPSWVPEPGQWAAVSIDVMQDHADPSARPNGGLSWGSAGGFYNAWSTAIHVPSLGEMGSLIIPADGGHNSYNGTDVYQYDIAARTWSQFMPSQDTVGDRYENEFGELPDGSPMPPHAYDGSDWTPFGADGGRKGSIFQAWTYNNFRSTSAQHHGHYLDLETKKWVRGPATGNEGRHTCSAVDPITNRFYHHGTDGSSKYLKSWPLDAKTPATQHGGGRQAVALSATMGLDHKNRTLMILSLNQGQNKYFFWDLENVDAGEDDAPAGLPFSAASSILYCDVTDKWYSVNSRNMDVWSLEASNLGGTFSEEPVSGPRPSEPINGLWAKMRWAPAIRCIIGCTRKNEQVFAYRPVGT